MLKVRANADLDVRSRPQAQCPYTVCVTNLQMWKSLLAEPAARR